MIRKSGNRFSEKIMLKPKDLTVGLIGRSWIRRYDSITIFGDLRSGTMNWSRTLAAISR
jgi:hypothetical protein